MQVEYHRLLLKQRLTAQENIIYVQPALQQGQHYTPSDGQFDRVSLHHDPR